MARLAPAMLLLVLAVTPAMAQQRKGAYPTEADKVVETSPTAAIAIKLGTVLMVLGFAGYLLKRMQERNKKEFLPDIDRAIPQAGKPRPSGLDVLTPKGLTRGPRPLAADSPVVAVAGEVSIWRDGASPFSSGGNASKSKPETVGDRPNNKFKPMKIEPLAAKINQAGTKYEPPA